VKLPVAWLRDFVDAPADVRLIADRLAACGFEVAGIEGDVIDLEVTANRPDCLTITGLAREVATAFGVRARGPMNAVVEPPAPNPGSLIPVTIEHEDCGRFTLAVLDVKVGASPPWLADRLAAAGVRPINNIVDVTNYVMLEVHPMHAFDAARLAGPELRIRLARPGESLKTLDGQTRALDPTTLVVADRDRAVSIAGIRGGANSEVSPVTTRIALEAAWWRPSGIRRTSRRLSLKTEAAARFERGADINGPIRAIARALELLESIGAARPAGPTLDVHPHAALPIAVTLRREALARLLGDCVPDDEVERILESLGFALKPLPEGWDVGVPTFRVDVRREADLVEEVGRHWGFNRIPATFPPLRSAPVPATPAIARRRTVGRVLTGAGLQEAATFTFIEEAAARPFVEEPAAIVSLANPLSEKFAVLRPSLLPGLLDALIYNRRRETPDVRLFEAGSVFGRTGERHTVAWVLTGGRSDHWSAGDGMIDIFDAKGIAELLAQAFGVEVAAEPIELPWFVRGRAARLLTTRAHTEGVAGNSTSVPLGVFGEIRREIAAARGLADQEPVVAAEIDLTALVSAGAAAARRVAPLPRFPSIVRDLSILVDERLPAAAVRGTIRSSGPPTLAALREFDRYQGRGVPAGRVSLSLRLTFRAADRTLTDAEVQTAVDEVVEALVAEHGAVLRGM
jgi:phenylalanyl-tRNA synthetase beta chain